MNMHRPLRALCACGLMAVVCAASPGAAQNDIGAQARRTLEVRVNKIAAILQEPGFINKTTRPEYRKKVEKEVAAIFDFTEFTARAVGPRWHSFTPEQRRDFSAAFANLLKATYLDRVDGYGGERVNYLGEQVTAQGDRVEVRTTLTMRDTTVLPVNYRMLLKEGNWVVYDVIIENISLVLNYRAQFQELLNKESPELLTTRVLEQARRLQESTDAR
jgi:phospholipid transport system substrate-binding protein